MTVASRTEPGVIEPGATIGILGGGQLGRMTALAAARLGYRCLVFEPQADCPASHVAGHVQADYADREALARFADAVDVVTLEFENVPTDALDYLAARVPVRPDARALAVAQHRAEEKGFLNRAGIETAPWSGIADEAGLAAANASIGVPSVLKTARLGYDGKGQVMLGADDSLENAWARLDRVDCVLEGFVRFEREVSVIAARSLSGEVRCFPAVENEHRNHILHRTIAPAAVAPAVAAQAQAIAARTIEALDMVGLLAVEMFVTGDGAVLVNEIAPRPHNSGHWTIDACATSQFEQLVRAVCGLPLGSTEPVAPAEMINLLGDDVGDWKTILAEPGARLHLYGKPEVRPGRKMGHVTRLSPPDGGS